eukprot:m.336933 g.336933  ORF g.336933 m.336933 type:complete len:240 (-) comp19799_c1_seq7:293-1012(-)
MYHHRAAEMPDKRTRGEMEALRAEMADLQQRFKQRDAKANLAAQRYKDKIQSLTEQNQELQDELRNMELSRLGVRGSGSARRARPARGSTAMSTDTDDDDDAGGAPLTTRASTAHRAGKSNGVEVEYVGLPTVVTTLTGGGSASGSGGSVGLAESSEQDYDRVASPSPLLTSKSPVSMSSRSPVSVAGSFDDKLAHGGSERSARQLTSGEQRHPGLNDALTHSRTLWLTNKLVTCVCMI